MDVQEALEHFANIPKIAGMLQTLHDVGLDYLKLGQAVADALRRRGAADQAGARAGQAGHGPDALHPRRADHRPALRGRPQAARGAPRLHGAGQHGGRDRAQPRRGQDGRLDHRPRPRGRRRRRPDRRRGDARGRSPGSPRATPGRRCERVLDGPKPVGRDGNGKPKKAGRNGREVVGGGARGDRRPGARQHNLKGIDVDIPRHKMTVCSGPSGSGKSSLAIDTLYAEGQRRYVESLSTLRPAVPRPAPEAEGRADQRPVAGRQHRAEDDEQEPALDGRHGHRDPRLPPDPLRPAGPAVLPELRHRRSARRRPTRSSRRSCTCPRGRRSTSWRRSSGGTARSTTPSGTTSAARGSPGSGSTAGRSASTTRPS